MLNKFGGALRRALASPSKENTNMGIELGKALALTAASGLVAGLAACGGQHEPAKDPSAGAAEKPPSEPAAAAAEAPAGDKECCKGNNDCKGKGNCKTDKNDCAGNNECKGQGGCKAPDCHGS